ncbi:unnamed protein product, partial [marine sediment metagenome]
MRITRSPTRKISNIEIDADIPMLTHILTGLGAGIGGTDSANIGQILEAIAENVGTEATAREEADAAEATAREEADAAEVTARD